MKFLWVIAMAMSINLPAHATAYLVEGTGVVTRKAALSNGLPTPAPAGSVDVGDALSFSFSFDTAGATVHPTFDANPAVNIYYLPLLSFSMSIGGYSYTPSFRYNGDVSLQLWNDYSSGSTDAQSFGFVARGANALPFPHQSGQMIESFDLHAFDQTGVARDTDLISEFLPYAFFGSRSFSWLQLNLVTQESVHLDGTYTASMTEIPEPSSAAILLAGLAIILAGTRRTMAMRKPSAFYKITRTFAGKMPARRRQCCRPT